MLQLSLTSITLQIVEAPFRNQAPSRTLNQADEKQNKNFEPETEILNLNTQNQNPKMQNPKPEALNC